MPKNEVAIINTIIALKTDGKSDSTVKTANHNKTTTHLNRGKQENIDLAMKTDPFKLTIIVTLMISIAVVGSLVIILFNNLESIPSAESGLIVSKSVINAKDSVVELSGGKTLYILNNTPLFLSLKVNQTYSFDCLFNYYTKTTYIESAHIT